MFLAVPNVKKASAKMVSQTEKMLPINS
uniref:Uncharacterized protein n=1 Tax=Lepeophtheirus salmonis TaxID=72036 RepID=A0A0K2UMA8_LEPSM